MADWLEAYARTTLENRRYFSNTCNDYKKRIKLSMNETKE